MLLCLHWKMKYKKQCRNGVKRMREMTNERVEEEVRRQMRIIGKARQR